jgi:selenocysteine lyase/cysteine desulfurase
MSIDVKKIRADFPMFRNGIKMQGHDLVFLDNASTTFKPDSVLEAVASYYTNKTSNSHRGDYDLCYNMDMPCFRPEKRLPPSSIPIGRKSSSLRAPRRL